MVKKEITIPAEKIEQFDRLIASIPEIDRKGVTSPYTSLNGNMFTSLSKEGILGLRLSKEDREAFIKTFEAQLFVSYGAIMKEYVAVPDWLLEDTEQLKIYLEKSFTYVKTLKPKATKKKK